jgi:hypothetical protein
MKGEAEVSDYFLAILYQYNGVPCIRCHVNGGNATWTFRCPQFDKEIIEQEFCNAESSVVLSAWIDAQKSIDSFRTQAKRGCGEWVSDRYAERAS